MLRVIKRRHSMRIVGLILAFVWTFLGLNAQNCPPEWVKYTYGGYLYDIQHDVKPLNLLESDFKNHLLNTARTNLARQIEVRVKDSAELNKMSVDGKTKVSYSSTTNFLTELDLKLVETRAIYNSNTYEGYAIAYVNKAAAVNFYKNELSIISNKISNHIELANNYEESGFKKKAQNELNKTLELFSKVEEPLFWINVFGAEQSDLNKLQEDFNFTEQLIVRRMAELEHSNVIYISCVADIFGKPYTTMVNSIKGELSKKGCSFTSDPQSADWVINIICSSREYSSVKTGSNNTFFAYIDAKITIDKISTSQRIYENEITMKGGHTSGFNGAAKVGYQDISIELSKIININLNQ